MTRKVVVPDKVIKLAKRNLFSIKCREEGLGCYYSAAESAVYVYQFQCPMYKTFLVAEEVIYTCTDEQIDELIYEAKLSLMFG